jgi:hypothetical protein
MKVRSDIMISVNREMQDYFIKLAPDFSVFDLAEKYYIDNNLTTEYFKDVFSFRYLLGQPFNYQTNFFRGMFLVYSDGDLSLETISGQPIPTDEYTVFPYRYYEENSQKTIVNQIVIAIQEAPFRIRSTTSINSVIGVAF